jgi:ABC-2 type transport system ATP-binding protein
MPSEPIIEAAQLTKVYRTADREDGVGGTLRSLFRPRYRDVAAVRDLSFRIEEGEVVAFLGPNGAGKTTALKMLAGLLVPSSGSVRVLGSTPSVRSIEFRRQISFVMGQRSQLSWDLPSVDSFRLHATIYSVPRNEYAGRLKELVGLFGVEDLVRRPLRELSLGERMKMELIAALLPQPRLFLLDEPTLGLDLDSQVVIRDCLRHYGETRRVTTLLTSHYMGDVESLGSRVLVINGGRLIYDGSLADLKARHRDTAVVTVTFWADVPPCLGQWGEVQSSVGRTVVLRVARPLVAEHLAAMWSGWPIEELSVQDISLEEIMVRVYRQSGVTP